MLTHWRHLNDALQAVLELDADQREAALGALDPELAQRVRAALQALDGEDVLAAAADRAHSGRTAAEQLGSEMPVGAAIGEEVGGFTLVAALGEGGMARVYAAERVQGGAVQRVALKRLRDELASPRLRQRFADEQRILAALEHPGIARLVAAGVDQRGTPYLATELVQGASLLEWCNARQVPVAGRLQLFERVCSAVSAAHRQLVVHRDLKPANILVTGQGDPKLLDFGISRLLDDTGAPAAAATHSEWRMLTPEYAAPEQLRDGATSTSVDIYALGVVLQELLVGKRPPTAAQRLAGAQLPAASSHVDAGAAAERGSSSHGLRRALRGDLDAIIERAVHLQADQRYPSVDALARDVRNHLLRRPVSARRGRAGYRSARFVRRHWVACGLALLAVVAAAAGVAAVVAESHQRQLALERAESTEQFLLDLFREASMSTEEAAARPVSALLEDGAARARASAAEHPQLAAHLLLLIGSVQDQLDRVEQAQHNFEGAAQAAHAASDAGLLARALTGQAGILERRVGDMDGAEELLAQSIALLEDAQPDSTALAGALATMARVRHSREDTAGAEALFLRAIDIYQRRAPDDPVALQLRTDLGALYTRLGRPDRAEALQRQALQHAGRIFGSEHITPARVRFSLGQALAARGEWAEADALMTAAVRVFEGLLPPDHIDLAAALTERARVTAHLGRRGEAMGLYDQALRIADARSGELSALPALVLVHRAGLLEREGRLEEALQDVEQAAARFQLLESDKGPPCWLTSVRVRLLLWLRPDQAAPLLAEPGECAPNLREAAAIAAHLRGDLATARATYAQLLPPLDAAADEAAALAALGQLPARMRYVDVLLETGETEQARMQLLLLQQGLEAAGVRASPELDAVRARLASLR